jgi:2-methylcitrate dehydratase
MDDTTRQIVGFITNLSFNDLDARAVDAGSLRVLDTVGCGLGALDAGPVQAARRASYPVAAGGARIWGSGERVSVEDAAFTNGIALRYLDFNDAYRGKVDVGHPSDNLGGLLALADARGHSGRALLEGMTVAYELQCRMAESVPLNDLGWDQPTAVVIASAAGAAKMLDLDAEGIANALAIAIIPHMAMHQARVPELTWWKGCAAAMGSRQGVYAARLAEQGMEGPMRAFDGKDGFWDQLGQQYGIP